MQVWNLLHAACWKYRTQKWRKNRHLGTIALLCWAISLQLRHVSKIEKKLVKHQYLLHMFLQYGELRHTSDWNRFVSLGHPAKSANFIGFHVLAVLLHGIPVLGVSQTLQRWTEGATYIWQGGHHVGHWPTFLVDNAAYGSSGSIAAFALVFSDIEDRVQQKLNVRYICVYRE